MEGSPREKSGHLGVSQGIPVSERRAIDAKYTVEITAIRTTGTNFPAAWQGCKQILRYSLGTQSPLTPSQLPRPHRMDSGSAGNHTPTPVSAAFDFLFSGFDRFSPDWPLFTSVHA